MAVVAAGGVWLVDGAPPLQWGRVLPEPYFEAPAVFLAAVSGGMLLYYVLVWGWPGPNFYRVALTALLAALALGEQVLVFRQVLAVQNAPPDPVLARTSGCVGDRGARFRFANEGFGEPRRALNHPPATGGPVTRMGLLFWLYRLTI